MTSYPLIALHGFLGQPRDWEIFSWQPIKAIDLFQSTQWKTLWDWAREFNHSCLPHSQSSLSKPVLMGYSLGGRLALHALIQNPDQWKAGIIISAHPGLKQIEEKKSRFKQDQEWAERFKQDDWNRLMTDWNQRSVFSKDGFHFKRQEQDFERQVLAYFLENASLAKQDDLEKKISHLSIPILWLVGEKDKTYCHLSETLTFSHPNSQRHVISSAGHRLPWEQPNLFKQFIESFLITI